MAFLGGRNGYREHVQGARARARASGGETKRESCSKLNRNKRGRFGVGYENEV